MSKGSGGGGYGSAVHKTEGQRLGAGATRQWPSGVAQIGQRVGDHVTENGATGYGGVKHEGPKMGAMGAEKLGNDWAAGVKCGVGGGATVYRSGAQGVHGGKE